jgi:hypothetical protein
LKELRPERQTLEDLFVRITLDEGPREVIKADDRNKESIKAG